MRFPAQWAVSPCISSHFDHVIYGATPPTEPTGHPFEGVQRIFG